MKPQAYGEAYRGGYKRTSSYLRTLGADRTAADEISQAAWARGWEHVSQLRDEQFVTEWVNTIARRLLMTSFRQPQLADLSEMRHEPPVAPSINPEVIDLWLALAKCTPRHHWLLVAFYWEGRSCCELAQAGKSPESIHAELYRARCELREHMEAPASDSTGARRLQ